MISASLNDNRISDCIWRDSTEGIFPPIFQDERNGTGEVLSSFILRFTLTVGSRNLRAVSHEPALVLFDDRRKLVVHRSILLPDEASEADRGRGKGFRHGPSLLRVLGELLNRRVADTRHFRL